MSTGQELVEDVKRIAGQYGQLSNKNMMAYPEVLSIIEYYEGVVSGAVDGTEEPLLQEIELLRTRLAEMHGQKGGQTKKINALKTEVGDLNEKLLIATATATTRRDEEIEDLKGQVADLESECCSAEEEAADLSEELVQVKIERDTLVAELAAAEQELLSNGD